MRQFVSILAACAMLSGCATAYKGPPPVFSKTGSDAITEYEKFRMSDSYGGLNPRTAEMGEKLYYTDSVEPILKDVSPTSWPPAQNKMKIGEYVSWGFFVATMATVFAPQDSWAHQTGYWVGLGGIIGSGIYINVVGMHAAEDYNKELKSKFSPSVGVTKSF